jgi:hypothetical protein
LLCSCSTSFDRAIIADTPAAVVDTDADDFAATAYLLMVHFF